jgi:hypothetical protein
MSRRESYKAPLHQIDFWIGIYQLKQIFAQQLKDVESDVLIPEFFTPSTSDRQIDDVDIYDIDQSLSNVKAFQDSGIPEAYSQLLSAAQLQHTLHAAIKANLMTTRVTGYVKKKTLFSFLNKSKGAAHLTTDMKLIPDVTSLEYRVCHAVLYMIQVEFEEVVHVVTTKVDRTMEHVKGALCATLIAFDPSLTIETIDESGLFLWSNPAFLTSWEAYVTSLQQKEDEINDATPVKKKSVLKKIRKSVTNSISSSSGKKAASDCKEAQDSLYRRVKALAPLHRVYLDTMEKLSSPASSCCFKNLSETNRVRPRGQSDCSDCGTEATHSKWYAL